jgi:hypothetical protein
VPSLKDLLKVGARNADATADKPPSKSTAVPSNRPDATPSRATDQDVQAFLSQVAARPRAAEGHGRLLFALDATASRQPTWDVATQLQAEMFESVQSLGGLQVQLCYFRGLAEFFTSDWQHDGAGLRRLMTGIHCEAGATKIERVLRQALGQAANGGLQAVVFIGDAMEENLDVLAELAGQLGMRNVPVFLFQEHRDPRVEQAFRELARLSGGAFSHFDSASAAQLQALLRAVAVYVAGGRAALKRLREPAAIRLLEQLQR